MKNYDKKKSTLTGICEVGRLQPLTYRAQDAPYVLQKPEHAMRSGGARYHERGRRAASVGLLGGRRGAHHLTQLLDEERAPPELQQRKGRAEEHG